MTNKDNSVLEALKEVAKGKRDECYFEASVVLELGRRTKPELGETFRDPLELKSHLDHLADLGQVSRVRGTTFVPPNEYCHIVLYRPKN